MRSQGDLNSKVRVKLIQGIVSLSKSGERKRVPLQPLAEDNVEESKSSQKPSRKRMLSPKEESSFSVSSKKRKLDSASVSNKAVSEPQSEKLTEEERRRELVS